MDLTRMEKHKCICQKQHQMGTKRIVAESDCFQNLREHVEKIGLSGPMLLFTMITLTRPQSAVTQIWNIR